VVPSHLKDTTRHNFKDIQTTGVPDAAGDTMFDEEPLPMATLPGLQVISL
jgi:tRNA 2-thiocytidine biosynthesis protein TtcA